VAVAEEKWEKEQSKKKKLIGPRRKLFQKQSTL
jgi:hypothetical protein